VSAYVEVIPTSQGSRAPRVSPGGTAKLPAKVEAQLALDGGSDAAVLEEVATSRAYGAPRGPRRARRATPPAAPPRDETPLGASASVATGGGGERVVVLGGLLLVLTVGLVGAAVYRRHRGRLATG
jgi:hypothetical protein